MIYGVEFLEDYTSVLYSNVCCFSGFCQKSQITFSKGGFYKLDVRETTPSSPVGIKSARKPDRLARFYIVNERYSHLHPDYVLDVPMKIFKLHKALDETHRTLDDKQADEA